MHGWAGKVLEIDQTPALAVIHCHPRTAIAFSLSRDEIVPVDTKASYLLKKVPVR